MFMAYCHSNRTSDLLTRVAVTSTGGSGTVGEGWGTSDHITSLTEGEGRGTSGHMTIVTEGEGRGTSDHMTILTEREGRVLLIT